MTFRLESERRDYDDDPRPRRRQPLRATIIACVVVALAGGLWAAYHLFARQGGGAIPLIRANDSPIKVAPQRPGGMNVPDQDMYILNQEHHLDSHVEQILPPPETPLPRPIPAAPDVNTAAAPAGTTPPAAGTGALPAAAGSGSTPQSAGAGPASLPATIPSAGPPSSITATAPPTSSSKTAPPSSVTATAPPSSVTATALPSSSSKTAPPSAAALARITPSAPAAPPLPERPPSDMMAAVKPPRPAAPPAAAHPPAETSVGGGGYRLQLGALRSVAAAQQEWSRLKRLEPEMLGRLHADAVRLDLGDRGIFYRIQAGPVADAAQADRMCDALKRHNVGCLLVRP
jgi:hypothetical protein